MRFVHWLLVVLAVVATAVAVRVFDTRHQPAGQTSALTPVGTVKELMEGIIDPSSDVLFDAVAVDISAAGIVETKPKTDEDWANVQNNALMLVEAANLLRMEGRSIAKPEEAHIKAEPNAPVLTPAQIELKRSKDPALWIKYANGLQDRAREAFRAANARNADGLFKVGDGIDEACESCHLEYWYPDDQAARAAAIAAATKKG
jgi:hypothetical protein